ncbi:MAG: MoaD/ThiS family protein [Candidatus Desulfacyla sp.]
MSESEKQQPVTIRVFGFLRSHMDDQGLPYTLERDIPREGCRAYDMVTMLSLPAEKVEAIFRNGQVINIYDPVFPGDRLALCPYGTPGPYRVFLGMVRENRERAKRENEGCRRSKI